MDDADSKKTPKQNKTNSIFNFTAILKKKHPNLTSFGCSSAAYEFWQIHLH